MYTDFMDRKPLLIYITYFVKNTAKVLSFHCAKILLTIWFGRKQIMDSTDMHGFHG
jgi:hypothetical protein